MKKYLLSCCGLLCLGLILPPIAAHAALVEGSEPSLNDLGMEYIEGEGDIPPAISIIRYSGAGSPPGVAGVPEPSTFLLAASAAAGLYALSSRRRLRQRI